MWLELASNNPCFNLDFFFLKDQIYSYFVNKIDQSKCNFFLIEGNHGLFDDIYLDGKTSNASLAKITKTPVVIVVDVSELGRSLVALLKGMVDFDKDVFISGVILNKIQSVRQEKKLIEAIKNYTDLPILGTLPAQSVSITQRHLGLTSVLQEEKKQELIENITSNLENYLDVTQITKIAYNAPKLHVDNYNVPIRKLKKQVVIAIAFDEAFNFYYKQNLQNLQSMGVEIKKFSPIKDESIPLADAIYIGGGFPELFLDQLQKNFDLRNQIKKASKEGLPIFAECGGLMYLTNSIEYNENKAKMCGIFNLETQLSNKPKGHGYTILSPKKKHSFIENKKIYAHEFHHGFFTEFKDIECFFDVIRGYGINGVCDYALKDNVMAGFSHIFDEKSDFFYNWIKENKLDS
ncbi:MAG: hypothetical protein C0173_01635 [Desulfurella sp.]|nr:MAG: hypothetical protein C0173_01635 [Desulfurella sp.]